MSVNIVVEALKDFQRYVDQLPEQARTSARIALNLGADRATRKLLPDAMQKEIAFPNGYLDGEDKLGITQRATDQNLEATILARQRATSLARFSPGISPGRTAPGGIRVMVKPGNSVVLKRAFAVRLKGSSAAARTDNFNIGLAIRLKPGETPRNINRVTAQLLDKNDNVFILYAPSVDQVMQTVLDEHVGEDITDVIETEFFRQIVRLTG